jgi:hypothetical protein
MKLKGIQEMKIENGVIKIKINNKFLSSEYIKGYSVSTIRFMVKALKKFGYIEEKGISSMKKETLLKIIEWAKEVYSDNFIIPKEVKKYLKENNIYYNKKDILVYEYDNGVVESCSFKNYKTGEIYLEWQKEGDTKDYIIYLGEEN